MKKKLSAILILVLFSSLILFEAMPANAYFYTGNEIVPWMREYDKSCQSDDFSLLAAGEFLGYVMGVVDMLENANILKIPSNGTVGQMLSIVSKYYKEHPEDWDKPACNLVFLALKEAFPQ